MRGILLITYYVPFLGQALAIQSLNGSALGLIIGAGLMPVSLVWLGKQLFASIKS